MKIAVFDHESLKANHDLVGDATIDVDGIKAGLVKKQTIEILYKGKHAGVVNLEFDAMAAMAPADLMAAMAGMVQGQPHYDPRASYTQQ